MSDTVPESAGKRRLTGGSRKGCPNKNTAALKDMILQALHESGGVQYLVKQAKARNPAAFLALVGKVLPMTVAGDPNAPVKLVVEWQTMPSAE